MKVTAMIPAFNEEKTIATIVSILKNINEIDEVIVINDGSDDLTEEMALREGAIVINMGYNQGKGAALQKGIENVNSDIILMLDGDLIGLKKEHVLKLLRPIIEEEIDMTIGVFNDGRGLTDLAQYISPNLSGQRALKADIFANMQSLKDAGYGVELALTRYIKKHGRYKFVELDELTHLMKEEKRGFVRGVADRAKMYWDILKVLFDRQYLQ